MNEKSRRTLLVVSMCPGDALRAASRLGARVVMVTDADLTWQAEYVDRLIAVDPLDVEAALESVTALEDQVDAITTFDERAVPAAALIAERLGLDANTYAAASAARNKYLMRTRCREHGMHVPRFTLVRTLAEADHASRAEVGYPLVVKPLLGFASLGVRLVPEPALLGSAFAAAAEVAERCSSFPDDDAFTGYVLLEQYLPGPEVAVDGLLEDGRPRWIGLFDKPECLDGPTFEDTLYVTPSELPERVQTEVLAVVEQGTRALGLTTGALHAEVRITGDGPRLVEIGARPIGGICGRAHSYCLGVDYSELVLRNALGEAVAVPAGARTPAGVMMIPASRAGRVACVEGLEEAGAVDGVRDILLMAKEGDVVRADSHEGCYLGFILATGETVSEVRRALTRARSAIRYELAPAPVP